MRSRGFLRVLAYAVGSLAILAVALDSFFRRGRDVGGCAMTYMWPDYVHMSSFRPSRKGLDRYALYLYKERDGRHPGDQPLGIPVLFIPGNAGSYKQARSLGSVLASQYFQRLEKTPAAGHSLVPRFDFFAVDNQEELAAFKQSILSDQAEYVNEALAFILSLYPTLSQTPLPHPTSVIIVAHSMGGMVARLLPTLENYNGGAVRAIVTLATPHLAPPAPLEWRMASMYGRLQSTWFEGTSSSDGALRNISIISIAGGTHDTMISSATTEISPFISPKNGFAVYSMSVPYVWTPADHKAILWCNQLTRAVGQSLYDIARIDEASKVAALEERMRILRNTFLSGMDGGFSEAPDSWNANAIPPNVPRTPFKSRLFLNSGAKLDSPRIFDFGQVGDGGFVLLTDKPALGKEIMVYVCRSAEAGYQCRSLAFSAERAVPSSEGSRTLYLTRVRRSAVQTEEYLLLSVSEWAQGDILFAEMPDIGPIEDRSSGMFGKIHLSVPVRRLLTEVRVPAISKPLVKYQMRWAIDCKPDISQHFGPVIHQSMDGDSSEERFLGKAEGSLLAAYSHPGAVSVNAGALVLRIFTDGQCDNLRIDITPDWQSSVGVLIGRYAMTLVAYSLVVVIQMRQHLTGTGGMFTLHKHLLMDGTLFRTSLFLVGAGASQAFAANWLLPEAWSSQVRQMFLAAPSLYSAAVSVGIYQMAFGLVTTLSAVLYLLNFLVGLLMRKLPHGSADGWRRGSQPFWNGGLKLLWVSLAVCCAVLPSHAGYLLLLFLSLVVWSQTEPTHSNLGHWTTLLLAILQLYTVPSLVIDIKSILSGSYIWTWDFMDRLQALAPWLYLGIDRQRYRQIVPTPWLVKLIAAVGLCYGTTETYLLFHASYLLFAWLCFQEGTNLLTSHSAKSK